MKKVVLLLIMGVSILPIKANAFIFEPVIDNCSETIENGRFGLSGASCGTTFKQGNEVAYQFRIDEEITVKSIEGWMSYIDFNKTNEAGADLVLYNGTNFSDYFGMTQGGDKIFAQTFRFPVELNSSSPADWHGVNNINLTLPTGTYWLAYEKGIQGTSLMAGNEARVRMEAVHTPEPSTILLLGGGLLGLLRNRRRSLNRMQICNSQSG